MVYPELSLKLVMLLVGLALIAAHLLGWWRAEGMQTWLRAFPRNVGAGRLLLAVAAVWFLAMIAVMDLGDFTKFRTAILVAGGAGTVLSWIYLGDFLAVRAAGMLLLMAAEPVLESTFMRPEPARLLLVALAYAWVFAGLFWVGMPYLMRDGIAWVTARSSRWYGACAAGALYGLALVAGGFAVA
jgi:hypothetical protein